MENRKNQLLSYFTKNIDQPDILISEMKRLNVFHLLHNKLDTIDRKDALYQNLWSFRQKQLNGAVEQEMIHLHNMALRHNIRLVFLKGLTLAAELYDPVEERKFGDIDVLVDHKDIDEFLDLLGNDGYIDTKDSILVSSKRKNHYTYAHHLCPFVKSGAYNLCLEVHLCPFCFDIRRDYKNVDVSQIMNRSRKLFLSEDYIYALDIDDALIHRLWDFTRNYTYDIQDMFKSGKHVNPDLSVFFDAVLFIDRHNQAIDWNSFVSRCKQWRICNQVLLAGLLLNTIYGLVVPETVITSLKDNIIEYDASLGRRLVPYLIDMDLNTILLGNSLIYMQGIYDKLKYPGLSLECPVRGSIHPNSDIGVFTIDETKNEKSMSRLGTHSRWGVVPREKLEASVEGSLYWDDRYLYVNSRIYAEDIINPENPNDIDTDRDVIFLWFDSGRFSEEKYFPRGIGIRIDKEEKNGECESVIESIGNTKEILGFDLKKIRIHKDGYEVLVGIPWKFLNVIPYKGFKFEFDLIYIKAVDEEKTNRNIELALSCINRHEDPTLFATVELV